ncbi:MAG TPA: fused MFS/spermidine synthase [Candidatus Polarisedimenticolia bacterium]|jgi:spermidine synthase|nr:fused MFS/spermidine synthase [Candidatus Polarisedimenticolia bacterium]
MPRQPEPSHPHRRLLLLLFFLSGFAALVLEMVWARRLSLLTGSGLRASAAIVALTIAGLALGARWGGKRADSSPSPLLVYGHLEAGVALVALATPFLFRLLPRLILQRFPGEGMRLDLGAGALLAAAAVLLPGTFLMGATTPFLVRHGSVHWGASGPIPPDGRAGRLLGSLYGWNTLGGSCGALASVFLMLPLLGVGKTTLAAGLIDAGVAAAAIHLARRLSPSAGVARPSEPAAPPGAAPPAAWRPLILLALFAAGSLGGICQIAWTRLLVLLFGSSAHALGLALAVDLAGLALGSVWAARRLRRGAAPRTLAAALSTAAGLATGVSILLWGRAPALLVLGSEKLGHSLWASSALQVLVSAGLLLPIGFAFGALLPALTALLGGAARRDGRDAGDGVAVDSWGTAAGALGAAFLLLPAAGVEWTLRLSGVVEVLLLLLLFASRRGAPRRLWLGAAAAILALLLAAPPWSPALMTSGPLLYAETYGRSGGGIGSIEESMRRRGALRFLEEGPEGTVTVREGAGGILSLQINGKTDASTGGDLPTQLLAGSLPAVLHAQPRTALVIGLASGTTAGVLTGGPARRVDCVEISPAVTRAAALFASVNGGVLENPRFHLVRGDGRAYLQRVAARYDLIVSQPTNPWIAGVTNLFTREFFALARERLAPGGLLTVWIQGYRIDLADFRSAVATFLQVFPEAQLWEESAAGGDYFLIGRRGGAWPGFEALEKGIGKEQSALSRAGIRDPADLLARFVAGPAGLRLLARGAPIVTDDNLRLEFSAPRALWRNRLPELIARLEEVRESAVAVFPPPAAPEGDPLRSRLEEEQSRRASRIRLALSLRQSDYEILGTPEISAAAALIRSGRADAALPLLEKARRQAPRAPSLALLEAWIRLSRGEVAAAGRAFHEASDLDPSSGEALNGEGLVAWRLGDLARAASLFQASAGLAPEDPEASNNHASVLLLEGKEAPALAILDRVVADHPRYVPAIINRGVALARLGRLGEAASDYGRALALEPSNADAAYNLERLRVREKER